MNISVMQGINFWEQLLHCYYKDNKYGGDTTEIYLYSMMEHSPTFANNPDSAFCEDEVKEAKATMLKLIARFEERYNCRVFNKGEEDIIEGVTLEGTHRFHLQVIRNE